MRTTGWAAIALMMSAISPGCSDDVSPTAPSAIGEPGPITTGEMTPGASASADGSGGRITRNDGAANTPA